MSQEYLHHEGRSPFLESQLPKYQKNFESIGSSQRWVQKKFGRFNFQWSSWGSENKYSHEKFGWIINWFEDCGSLGCGKVKILITPSCCMGAKGKFLIASSCLH